MKKMIMTLMAAVLVSSAALAQDDKQKGQRPEKKFDKTEMIKHRTDKTVKKYKLDDKQAKQLLELNTEYAEKMEPRGHHGPHGHHGHGPRPSMKPGDKKVDGTTGATPQPPKGEAKDGKRDGKPKGKRPELTEEQKAKMEADRKEREATMKAYDAKLQKIMTADQFKQYQEDMKKMRERKPNREKKDK